MGSEWFVVGPNGEEEGPYDASEVRRMAQEGEIRPETLLRRGDIDAAARAERVRGLFADTKTAKSLPEESPGYRRTPFVPLGAITTMCVALLGLWGAAGIFSMVAAFALRSHVVGLGGGEDLPPVPELEDRMTMAILVEFLSLVVAGILFLVWLYLAYRNVSALGQRRRLAPWWAVLSWFVCLVHLVVPFLAVKDLLQGSIRASEGIRRGRADVPIGPLPWIWWGAFLLHRVVVGIGGVGIDESGFYEYGADLGTDLDALASALSFSMVGGGMTVAVAALTIWLVTTVKSQQTRAVHRMHS